MDDWQLLREYAEGRSAAFEQLVRRHVGMVYGAALRQAQDPHLAEDVTQGVFIALARKAGRLHPSTVLAGWLFNAARLASLEALRRERRRRRHEREAAAMAPTHASDEQEQLWRQIAPMLDPAIARLRTQDRDALVLRFLEGRSMKEVGLAMGISEDAAKMRISRAVAKLRQLLAGQGVDISPAALAAVVPIYATPAAPASLMAMASSAALGSVAETPALIAKGALHMMTMAKIKAAAVVLGIVLMAAAAPLAWLALAQGGEASPSMPPTPTPPVQPAIDPSSPAEIGRRAVLARLEALRAIEMEYSVEEVYTPRSPLPTSPAFVVRTGTTVTANRFCLLDGRVRWECNRAEAAIEEDRRNNSIPISSWIRTYTGAVGEQLTVAGDRPRGSIDPATYLTPVPVITLGLGLRDGDDGGWMSAKTLEAMQASIDPDGRLVLQRTDERGRILEWVHDPARAYALVAYRRLRNEPPHPVVLDVVADDFREVNGIVMPFSMTERTIHTDGVVVARFTARVDRYILNGPDNTPDLYYLRWPAGIEVLDRTKALRYRVLQDGLVLRKEEAAVRKTALTELPADEPAAHVIDAHTGHQFSIGPDGEPWPRPQEASLVGESAPAQPSPVAVGPMQPGRSATRYWPLAAALGAMLVIIISAIYLRQRKEAGRRAS